MDTNNDQQPEWFKNLPDWAQVLIGGGLLIGGVWVANKAAEIEREEQAKRLQVNIEKAEREVSELLQLSYDEAISIMRDAVPKMDSQYWMVFIRRLESASNGLKARNIYARVKEFRANFDENQSNA